MDTVLATGITALWLGILTSISPCPLATNIAAVSYISSDIKKPLRALTSGVLYTSGRMVSYSILGSLLVSSALAVFSVSNFLQHHMNQAMGPLLLIIGLVLVGAVPLSFLPSGFTPRASRSLTAYGSAGAFLLGMLFALSFCPVSAALFFGSLLPIAVGADSRVILPAVYGLGTALPVLVVALALTWSTRAVANVYNMFALIEKWFRPVTGIIFIFVGIYYVYTYIIPST